MGASINRGPQNRPKYIMVLIIGTTKMGPLICGNSHIRKPENLKVENGFQRRGFQLTFLCGGLAV